MIKIGVHARAHVVDGGPNARMTTTMTTTTICVILSQTHTHTHSVTRTRRYNYYRISVGWLFGAVGQRRSVGRALLFGGAESRAFAARSNDMCAPLLARALCVCVRARCCCTRARNWGIFRLGLRLRLIYLFRFHPFYIIVAAVVTMGCTHLIHKYTRAFYACVCVEFRLLFK